MARGQGLYIRAVKARTSNEDLLTEFLAAALRASPEFAGAYVDLALSPFAQEHGWMNPVVESVETQQYVPPAGTPDMLITLRDDGGRQHVVAVEHKIRAAETGRTEPAPAGAPTEEAAAHSVNARDDLIRVGQLERYLGSDRIDAVLYVRENRAALPERVVTHPKYVRAKLPQNEYDHFLWNDFYEALSATSATHEQVEWLREGFVELHHYTPVHPFVGELETTEQREEFRKYWRLAYESAGRMGWQPTYDDHWGLFMWKNPSSLAETIGLKPLNGRFRIRVMAAVDADVRQIQSQAAAAVGRLGIEPEWQMESVTRKNRDAVLEKMDVLDGWADIAAVLGANNDGEAIIRRLDEVVRRLSEALDRQQAQDRH